MRRRLCILVWATLVCAGCLAAEVPRSRLPNIIFILADDLGIGDPGCYNSESRIPTPHIDRLAREGLRFVDMHTPSAVCTPTRYGLLTGRYAWRSRLKSGVLWGWSPPLIEPERLTLPAMLQQRGYVTAGFGKWHLGLGWATREPAAFGDGSKPAADPELVDYAKPLSGGPRTAGFDRFFGIPASLDMEPYLWVEDDHCVTAPTEHTEGDKHQRQGGAGFYRAGPMAPGFRVEAVLPEITRRATGFIETQARSGRGAPLFVYLALSAPHDPWLPSARFVGKSGAGPRGDFVAQTDATVGEVLQLLDRLGWADETLVIFSSDNGAHWLPDEIVRYQHAANGPWRGQKADIHEGGHRVPCVIRWPGRVRPGTVTGQLACLTDFMATFAELTGARLASTAAEDSFSFAALLTGRRPEGPLRQSLVMHSSQGMFAIRRGGWKLIEGLGSGGFTPPARAILAPGGPAGQLYDLYTDPLERTNRFPDAAAEVQALASELSDLKARGQSRLGVKP